MTMSSVVEWIFLIGLVVIVILLLWGMLNEYDNRPQITEGETQPNQISIILPYDSSREVIIITATPKP